MRHLRTTSNMRMGLLAVLLCTAGGLVAAAHADETPKALAADHIIACIKTSVAGALPQDALRRGDGWHGLRAAAGGGPVRAGGAHR